MPAFSPNRELLNVHFEGYKLSSKDLTKIQIKNIPPVRVTKLKDDEYSYQYVRAYTLHNHLQHDPTDPKSVYWCNEKGSVMKSTLEEDSISSQCIFSFPESTGIPLANFSMSFFSDNMGVVCAGDDKVIIFKRELSSAAEGTVNSEKWITLTSVAVGNSGYPVVIVTAAPGENYKHVDILCTVLPFNVEDNAATDEAGNTFITYEWLRICLGDSASEKEGMKKFEAKTLCELHSKSLALYAALQREATSGATQLLFMSETEPKTTFQKETSTSGTEGAPSQPDLSNRRKIGRSEEEDDEEPDRHYGLGYKEDENEGKVYTWNQSEEDVTISFKLPEDITRRDVVVTIEPPEIVVSMADGNSLLRGELTHDIDMEGTTWTLDKNVLEVTLAKKIEGVNWKYLLREKNSGENASKLYGEDLEELTDEEKQKAKELFKQLQEDSQPMEKKPCVVQPAVVQNMLEECDRSEEDTLLFVVTEQGQFEAKVDVEGHQVLFVSPGPGGPGHPNIFSLRHDVDATIWLPHSHLSSKDRWTHLSTFNALGYVQASKRERKFTKCSPDLSCAVICDCTRHVFVYSQPDKSTKTAVEYVHTFLETGNILGVVASNGNTVFVLTDKELCVLKIPSH